MANTSKMRMRSTIISILNKYRSNPTVDNEQIKDDNDALNLIEDKESTTINKFEKEIALSDASNKENK